MKVVQVQVKVPLEKLTADRRQATPLFHSLSGLERKISSISGTWTIDRPMHKAPLRAYTRSEDSNVCVHDFQGDGALEVLRRSYLCIRGVESIRK